MVRFPEAIKRLYSRVYICRKCKKKVKTNVSQILSRRLVCKGCGGKAFRPIKSKKATVAK